MIQSDLEGLMHDLTASFYIFAQITLSRTGYFPTVHATTQWEEKKIEEIKKHYEIKRKKL